MKFFKSLDEKEAERRGAFSELLQSDEAHQILFGRFLGFLQSDEVGERLFKVLVDARLQGEVEAAIADVKRQLIEHVGAEVRQLRTRIDAAINHWYEEIPRRSADMRRCLKNSLAEHEREITELTRVSALSAIEKVLTEYLHDMLREEVMAFVRVHPLCSGFSNRQLAAANGISIREVKRRRRRGYL
jgi:hypothetical protein